MKKRLFLRLGAVLLMGFVSASDLAPQQTDENTLVRLYGSAQFSRIIDLLAATSFEMLTGDEQILYIECLARTGRGSEAERLLAELRSGPDSISRVEAASGMVYLSLGQFDRAEAHIRKALAREPDSAKAKMTAILLMLYLRDYQKATRLYEEFGRTDRDWAETYLFHLIGIETYGATGHIDKIGELYKEQAAKLKSQDKDQSENCRKVSRLYQRPPQKRSFELTDVMDKVEMPFSEPLDITRCPTLTLKTEDRPFTIILDTGNRIGWLVHSRELDKRLGSKAGGTGLAQIGTEEGLLHGRYILTKKLELGRLLLTDLAGMYIPKPHPSYPDANLNPLFIKDRVITLDFIKEALILRSDERFHDDLNGSSSDSNGLLILPWYGYDEAFIPVTINGNKKTLAMLETGAGGITLRLDFAESLQMPLEPAVRFLASGKQAPFHRTPLSLSFGHLRFDRLSAEVWALGPYADALSGFAPNVILGPDFFKKKWAVSFDPYGHRIVLSNHSH